METSNEVVEFGLRKYKINTLRLPGDWPRILESQPAQDQAESIRTVGLIHYPVVRKSDRLVICGHTRLAGLMILGETHVQAKVIECNDEQVEAMRSHENSERAHDPVAQRAARKARLAEIAEEISEDGQARTERKLGTEARDALADEEGIKRASVHQYEWRQRQRELKAAEEAAELRADPVADRGMEMDDAFLVQLGLVRRRVREAKAKMTSAVTTLRAMKTQGLPFSHGKIDELAKRMVAMATDVANESPRTLCYFCRALRGIVEDCADCKSTGWLSTRALADAGGIPPALADDDNPAVLYRGDIVTVDDYLRAHAPQEPEEDLDALWS
jgi:ParB-like chromosome segregation protein Spo0J